MNKTYKFRIYPNKKQTKVLEKTLEVCRMTYNDLLSKRIEHHKATDKTLSCYDQQKYLTTQKNIHEGLKTVFAQALQDVCSRVDLAFRAFFRRTKDKSGKAGFPRFKQYGRYDSFTYPQYPSGFKLSNNKIHLSKIGDVDINQHREIQGTIKTCNVNRSSTGKWFVCICCKDVPCEKLKETGKKIGIDLGISKFATISNGKKITNPKFFKTEEKALAKAQCKLSKLKKCTKEYKRQKKIIARIHERIKNKRDNFTHQKSRLLINKYDVICVEDLNINRMKVEGKYPRINKSIGDVAWRDFIGKLEYKAEEAGRQVIKINPAYTSQICSKCFSKQKMILLDKQYHCNSCGLSLDRDLNASYNILRLGLQSLGSAIEAQELNS